MRCLLSGELCRPPAGANAVLPDKVVAAAAAVAAEAVVVSAVAAAESAAAAAHRAIFLRFRLFTPRRLFEEGGGSGSASVCRAPPGASLVIPYCR